MWLLRERLNYFIEKYFPNSPRVKQILPWAWIIERLDTKLMSRGLISYRRLVVSCSKMALHGSIIVEICDETMAKMWRKLVEMQGLLTCMLFFFGVFSGYFNFWCVFFLPFLACSDEDPSKPHLNLRGKHFLLLVCVICPCFWENCIPKIDLTRAIFSRLGDGFGTPLLRKFLLVSIHNYDWQTFQGWNCPIRIVTDWVLLFSSHTLRLKKAEINYIRSWRRVSVSVRTRFVKFQSANFFVSRTVSSK